MPSHITGSMAQGLWRAMWALGGDDHFSNAGCSQEPSHLSFAEQQLSEEPGSFVGVGTT
jgi:hypothetical protein